MMNATDSPAPSAGVVPNPALPQERSLPARRGYPSTRTAGQRGGPRTRPSRFGGGWWSMWWRAFLAEFTATALLVGLGASSSGSAWAFGILVLANSLIFGRVSGAHMNPAVSLAAAITEHLTWPAFAGYAVAQILGAVFGMAVLAASYVPNYSRAYCLGCTIPGVRPFPALILELGVTFMLVLVFCVSWERGNDDLAPFKIGIVVAGMILVSGSRTGGSLNPARSFGPALIHFNWTRHWVYWLGPLSGAALAASLHRFVLVHILSRP